MFWIFYLLIAFCIWAALFSLFWISIDRYRNWRIENSAFNPDLYAMVFLLLWADGIIGPDEGAMLEGFVDKSTRSGSTINQLAIMQLMREARASGKSFGDFARSFVSRGSGNLETLEIALEYLVMAAGSDGKISTKESKLLEEAASIFGFSKSKIEQIYRRLEIEFGVEEEEPQQTNQEQSGPRWFNPENEDPRPEHPLAWAFSELDCNATDDRAEIKRCYREAVKRFHPDRMRVNLSNPELIKQSEQRFIRIQKAFEALEKEGMV